MEKASSSPSGSIAVKPKVSSCPSSMVVSGSTSVNSGGVLMVTVEVSVNGSAMRPSVNPTTIVYSPEASVPVAHSSSPVAASIAAPAGPSSSE